MILSKISINKLLLVISIVIAICFGTISLATLNAANTSDPDNLERVKVKFPIVVEQAKSEELTLANGDNAAAENDSPVAASRFGISMDGVQQSDSDEKATTTKGRIPAHTPEWTDYNEHDPGTTDNSQDDKESEPKTGKSLIGHELTHVTQSSSSVDAKHKEWINIESVSQAGMNKSDLVDAIAKKKNLDTDGLIGPKTNRAKESGEKGGTTDMNIGLGELQESKEGLSKELIDKNKPCKDDCQELD